MLAFSKIITALILPPGIFILILFLCLIFLIKKKYLITKIIIISTILLIYLLSIEPIKNLLVLPLENEYPALNRNIKYTDIDFIVILGGGTIAASPEEENKSVLATASTKRTLYGARLHHITKKPIIISGGIVFKKDKSEPEALVAKKFLIELGIHPSKIKIEANSRNTWENAKEIKNNFAPDKILLVTSAYHMPRSVFCFKENGIETIPCPTDYMGTRTNYNFESFFPRAGNLGGSYIALKEYLGYLYYKIRYEIIFPKFGS